MNSFAQQLIRETINRRDTSIGNFYITLGQILIIVLTIIFIILSIIAIISVIGIIFLPLLIIIYFLIAVVINDFVLGPGGYTQFKIVLFNGPFDVFNTEQLRKLEPDEKTPWPEDFKKEIRELIREKNRKRDGKKLDS